MDYSIEKIETGTKINFTLTVTEWNGYIEKAYQKKKSGINIPGFRKGHAPRHLIEKMYGKNVFADDAFDICFRECYSKALTENLDIYPVEEPNVNIETIEGDVKFSATFAVKPDVILGEYKGLTIDKKEYKVTKNDVDGEVEKARERLSRKVIKESAVENGDTVNLDYSGSVDGVKFEGGTAEAQELVIGSNSFIPGFEVQLIGANKGEIRDITVKFPDDYHAEDLKGKEAVFNCKINEIFTKELPEINDEMAKEVSAFDTLKEYKEDIEKKLNESNTNRANAENEDSLIKAIVEKVTVVVPDAMVESELNYMLEDLSYRLMYMYGGMKIEDYFKYTGTTVEEYRKTNKAQALNNVKTRLTLERIIKDEKIEISDEDYEKEILEQAEKAKKTVEEFKKTLQQGQEQYIRNSLISKKLMQFLKDNNTFAAKVKTAKKAADKK